MLDLSWKTIHNRDSFLAVKTHHQLVSTEIEKGPQEKWPYLGPQYRQFDQIICTVFNPYFLIAKFRGPDNEIVRIVWQKHERLDVIRMTQLELHRKYWEVKC